MSEMQDDDDNRNTIMTRFVLIYIICILCAVVPLYYLFNIPGKAIQKLKVSEMSVKSQKIRIDRYQSIMTEIDKYLAENKFEKEYKKSVYDLYAFAKDSIDEKNLYKPLFIKITDLYQAIEKMNEGSGKAELERLTEENKTLKSEKKDLEKERDDLKEKYFESLLKK
jgi:hypothetical protein